MSTQKNDVREFGTGAIRNAAPGKLKMSLVPHKEFQRVMKRYAEGAENFGNHNWSNGMPLSELYDSAQRHMTAWFLKETDEDHLAAACWNMLCAMWMEKHKPEMDDRGKL